MPVQTHLMNRKGIYYCRVPVPKEYQPILGKKEIWKSLGCRTYLEAIRYAKIQTESIMQGIEAMAGKSKLTDEIIEQIAEKYYFLMLGQDESQRTFNYEQNLHNNEGMTPEQKAGFRRFNKEAEEGTYNEYLEALQDGNVGIMREPAMMQLEIHDIELDSQNFAHRTQFRRLCLAMLRSKLKALQDARKRSEGDSTIEIGETKIVRLSEDINKKLGLGAATPDHVTFGNLLERYNNARENAEKSVRLKDKINTYQHVIADLVSPSMPVDRIDRALARQVCDKIRLMPHSAYKKYPNKTLPQIIEETKEDKAIRRLSASSVNDYIEHFGQLLTWARREGYNVENQVSDLRVKEDKREKKRIPFTLEQLNLIFSEKGILRYKNMPRKEHEYWVPVVFFITGSRPGEIIHYRVSDIRNKQGIPYISVNIDEDGKSVKTVESLRDMAIHDKLIELGFLEYVAKIEKQYGNKSLLFPHNTIGKKSSIDPFSKRFNARLRKLGITDKRYVLYSFRHNYKDFEREYTAGAPATANAGWATGKEVHETYGQGYNLSVKREAINKIRFDGVKLFENAEVANEK